MPLLGRHKSQQAAQQQKANSTTRQQVAAVCESPAFGIRRQLPAAGQYAVSDQKHQQTTAAASAGGSGGSSSSGELSSIPQHITSQQIHYAFSMMDTNSDGLINLDDLSKMLANLGIPIDGAILSHVLAPVSKRGGTRGDQLISEQEFLAWIGNFVQVTQDTPQQQRQQSPTNKAASSYNRPIRQKLARCSTSNPSSLVADLPTNEAPGPPGASLRQRRGSGSGLALMRSLSSSAVAGSHNNKLLQQQQMEREKEAASTSAPAKQSGGKSQRASKKQQAEARAEQEAAELETRNDLKAAFCVFDLDGDGFITIDEVRAGLKLLGETWSQAELNQVFNSCGGGGSSSCGNREKQRINIDDFVQLLL